MALEFATIDTPAAFAGLREQWNELARRSAVDHAFMRHEWFSAWLEHLPWRGELRVLTAHRDGRLVGAAPLRLERTRRRGMTVRLLSFLQSGISPRCHFLVDRDEDPTAIFDGLWSIEGWDLAELKSLAEDEALTGSLVDHLVARGTCIVETGGVSPYQEMPADWTAFEKTRSKGFRKRFRNSNNRCRKADGFELLKIETAAAFDDAFADMLEISTNSWKAAGGTDLVTQAGMGEFFRSFARATAADGLWVVYLLRLGGRPAAFDFYVRHDGRLVGLRWEYDESFSYYMPGVVVHVAAIRDLLEDGGREYDLAGTDTDFKSGLVDAARNHVDITFARGGFKSRVLIALKDALVQGRRDGLLPGG